MQDVSFSSLKRYKIRKRIFKGSVNRRSCTIYFDFIRIFHKSLLNFVSVLTTLFKKYKKVSKSKLYLIWSFLLGIWLCIKDPNKSNTQKYFRHSNVKRYELALLRSGYFIYLGRLFVYTRSPGTRPESGD